MNIYPQLGVVRLLARAIGPEAFSSVDQAGQTPLDVARMALIEKFGAGDKSARQLAFLERAVLSSIKKQKAPRSDGVKRVRRRTRHRKM
jgi:hypothetical protein